jgi:aspartate carbamoyltransferase catalytic subunit
MKQLLRIEDLSSAQIKKIIESAHRRLKAKKILPLKGKTKSVGLVFAEPSTRTRVSFERAARSLGMESYLLEPSSSSLSKGEDLRDTILNLQALGVQSFVVRSGNSEEMLALRDLEVSVLNAGDGVGEHPTQALLDLLCLFEKFGASWAKLQKQKICIVGNLSHSRVVNSWVSLGKLLKIPLSFVSPKGWEPRECSYWSDSLSEGLSGATVVMALRVQKERLGSSAQESSLVSLDQYVARYQISEALLSGRPLMHPGPVNWGLELDSSLRTYKNSLILDQVRCGLYLRATLLNDFIAS